MSLTADRSFVVYAKMKPRSISPNAPIPTPVILDPTSLTKYVVKLPQPIKLEPIEKDCYSLYHVKMLQGAHQLHPQVPPTPMWTYNGESRPLLIEVERHHHVR